MASSLFSFEVAVQHLRVNAATVPCRFPALAVRLLDFPTLLIPHLDDTERDSIRQAMLFEAGVKVPNIFKELLDSRGNFQFDKGKSCMFKFDIHTLHENLQNVPLYVMIVDLWGEAQKLIGVCTIPLVDVISDIRHDVELKGISCPSMHGQQDIFPIFNLMGSEIGNVSLGYRMLSLGQSLLPHIPAAASVGSMELQDKERFRANFDRKSSSGKVIALQQEPQAQNKSDLNTHQYNSCNNFEMYTVYQNDVTKLPESTTQHLPPDEESGGYDRASNHSLAKLPVVSVDDQQTQTYIGGKGEFSKKFNMEMERPFDPHLIVGNTHCPPPLFFNSNHDSNYGHVSYSQPCGMNNIPAEHVSPGDSWSDSSESYHSKTMEMAYKLQSELPGSVRKIVRESRQLGTTARKTRIEQTLTEDSSEVEQHRGGKSENSRRASMPILTALLEELSILTGAKSSNFQKDVDGLFEEKENIQPALSEGRSTTGAPTPKNMVSDIPQNLQSPKHTSCRHDRCAKPSKPVPSAKGWLRKEPKLKKRQTKLHFKMTHSQKLRLKMNNPELLKTMEAEERKQSSQLSVISDDQDEKRTKQVTGTGQRKTKNRTKRTKVVSAARSPSVHSSQQYPDVPTEVARIYVNSGKFDKEVKEDLIPPSRPPMPTPRKSLSVADAFGLSESDDYHGKIIPFDSTEDRRHGFDKSASEKSATRSIEVYIPNPSLLESDTDSDSAGEEPGSRKSGDSLRDGLIDAEGASSKKRSPLDLPDFRAESLESATIRSSVYSQDFESIKDDSDKSQSVDDSRSSHSSHHSDQPSSGDELSSRVSVRSDRQQTVRSPGSSKFSSRSEDQVLDSAETSKSWSPRELSKNLREDPVQSTKEGVSRDLSEQPGKRKDGNISRDGFGELPVKSALSRLPLPRPPLSSVSPIPQHRNPIRTKIVMTKPVSINVDEYNDSGEVNLPSDLSVSFENHQRRRDNTSSLGSSEDVPQDHRGRDSHGLALDVVRSAVESKGSIDEYSHDFDSDE